MPLISRRTIDAVNDLDLLDVLKDYNCVLKRSGKDYIGCCPFHNERTPSFHVTLPGNLYKCFGCGKGGGGVINFVMDHDGLEFQDAVLKLANSHNILVDYESDERSDAEKEVANKRDAMKAALRFAQTFFVESFIADNAEAQAARNYAYGRWGEDFCKLFGVGYAPRDSQIFIDYIKKNYGSPDIFFEVGLLGRDKETGKTYSLFRQRITLPVRNRFRDPITFSARYIGNNTETIKRSKYLNLSESLIFKKNDTLFGIDTAIRAAKEKGHFTLVEGGPDVMRLHLVGISQAVAPMGTALTENHLAQMKRVCSSICFVPDSDPPKGKVHGSGIEAVMRNGKLAMNSDFDISVKEIPRTLEDDENEVKYDADSYITDKSIYASLETIPFVVWYAKKRLGSNPTTELQSAVINEVAGLMIHVMDESLRELYLSQLRKIVGTVKMWRDAIKRAGRKATELEVGDKNLPPEILASQQRCGLIVKNGCYYYADNDGNLDVSTNFIFKPVLHIQGKRSIRIMEVVNVNGQHKVIEFASSDLSTTRDFKRRIYDKGNFFLHSESAFSPIVRHILEVTPTAEAIEILGWDSKRNFYAFSNGVFHKGSFINANNLGVVAVGKDNYFLPAFSDLYNDNETGYSFERLFRYNPNGTNTLSDFVAQLIKVYGNGGMVSFAWTLAAIYRDIIFDKLKWFPMLNLFGRKGSGKTELARTISSLFYVLPSSPPSLSSTSIPVIGYNLSHVRNSVLILDEFTNDLMPNRIDIVKNIWGGTVRGKMEDGMPNSVPVNSALILAGQYKPEDEAIFSRCIHLMYTQSVFTSEQSRNYDVLKEMVLHGNTHLLPPLLEHRNVLKKGFSSTYNLALTDVTIKLDDAKVDTRILNNWIVVLATFRILEPYINVPFSYNDLLKVVVDGIIYQNEQIKKSSDTANFWLYLDSMHSMGKAKEKCHFVIKMLSSFSPYSKVKKEETETRFVEPKRVIFLNFKAVRALLEMRLARQKYGSTLDLATLESYLKSLPQFMGMKQQRFQNLRTNGELDEEFKTEDGKPKKIISTSTAYALCFDYDALKQSLDLNLETFRISEDELNEDVDKEDVTSEEPSGTPKPIQNTLFKPQEDDDLPF